MVSWHPQQYLKFADERSRPCFDLIQRVHVASPQTIVDLGCGPGNSTAALAQRWPEAHTTGLDSSSDMIDAARRLYPKQHWMRGDIATWTSASPVDLIFSNAALQWVDNHTELLPRLLGILNPGGALAIAMPANYHTAPAQILMRDLAAGAPWNTLFPGDIRKWQCHEPAFYYDLLIGAARNIDLWTSEYIHIFRSPEQIVEWYKGTGLRPYLDMLPVPKQQTFLAAYQSLITQAYPPRPDGRILFPFRRLFLIAYR